MRKVISVILTLILVFAVFNIATLSASAADLKVVYLDSVKGNDSNSGATTGKAVATLFAAFAKLGDDGGIINVSGDTVIDDTALTDDMQTAAGYQLDMPAHTGKVYITSHNGSKLIKKESSTGTVISLFGPVEIFNITIENTQAQNINFYTYANEFTIGMGFTATADTQAHCPRIFGFTANPADGMEGNPIINVYSGTLGDISGAGTKGAKTLTGNPTINIYGGSITSVSDSGAGGIEGNTIINVYKDATVNKINATGAVSGTRTLNLYNFTTAEEAALEIAGTFDDIKKGLTATAPTPASNSISFAIVTDDPNETTVAPVTTEAPVTTTKAPATTKTPATVTPSTSVTPSTTTSPKKAGCGKSSSIFVAIQVVLIVGSAVTYTIVKKH